MPHVCLAGNGLEAYGFAETQKGIPLYIQGRSFRPGKFYGPRLREEPQPRYTGRFFRQQKAWERGRPEQGQKKAQGGGHAIASRDPRRIQSDLHRARFFEGCAVCVHRRADARATPQGRAFG